MADARPGEIETSVAAALLGISTSMLSRVIRQGFVEVHRRGFTTLNSAVAGYARFLMADAETSAASAAAARSHAAKAARVRQATARRMADLTDRQEAEGLVNLIADGAVETLRTFRSPTVSPGTAAGLSTAIRQAVEKVEQGKIAALRGLATGVFDE